MKLLTMLVLVAGVIGMFDPPIPYPKRPAKKTSTVAVPAQIKNPARS